MPGSLEFLDLGLCDYKTVHKKQIDLVERIKCGETEEDHLLFVEHPEVYTYGRKSKEQVADLPLAVWTERGGEATYHNPGQLVAYPILRLKPGEQDVHLHLRRLENVVIGTLNAFSIRSERREGETGVWITGGKKKIASIGVSVSSWVTYHGVALNVCNDLSGFYKISPCGYSPDIMTNMINELQSQKIQMLEVKNTLLENFEKVFERKCSNR